MPDNTLLLDFDLPDVSEEMAEEIKDTHELVWRTCESCNDPILESERDSAVYVTDKDGFFCQSCTDSETTEFAGDIYTTDYIDDNTFCCDGCGEQRWDSEHHGNGYCNGCSDDNEEDDSSRYVHGYGTDALDYLHFAGDPKDGIYFGVELEVEVGTYSRDDAAEWLSHALSDIAILKYDGSLSNGFEIVTAPSSLEVLRTGMEPLFDTSRFERYGLKSWHTTTCGMHVHVSRAPLTLLQIGTIQAFLHAPENYTLVRKIAGRCSAEWSGYSTKKEVRDVKNGNPNRYTALNLENDNTIEFRLFRGTLLKAGFFRNVEFVHALINYTKLAGRSIHDRTSGRAFLLWLITERTTYPNLTAFLSERGFIPQPKPNRKEIVPCA